MGGLEISNIALTQDKYFRHLNVVFEPNRISLISLVNNYIINVCENDGHIILMGIISGRVH